MKAKRIVSILLTGSMLLSLLPVSALAAAPVFDAPAQTTAKKTAPLVQEADASRSTEEEAATRSSRDLDAENGTAESITIQLNAEGKPADSGDDGNWYYSADSGCQLDTGVFALQPSSEPEAESALKARLFRIGDKAELVRGTVGCETNNYGTISGGIFQGKVANFRTISGGTFQGDVNNYKTISDGTFQGEVGNDGTISGGTFQSELYNFRGTISNGTFQGILRNDSGTISGGTFENTVEVSAASGTDATIEGGTFKKSMTLKNSDGAPIIISNGLFNGEVVAEECYAPLSISGGLFTKDVDVSDTDPSKLSITGGYFVNEPALPQGSNIAFTTVSDQSCRAFHVPVNDDWSESGYNKLYVPNESSEQPNTITVKTNTKLLYYLADGERVNVDGRDSDSYIYEIPVRGYEKIVLVTEEPSAPPTDDPGELDPAFSSGAAALGVVLGTAGLGYITYAHISSLYLYYTLPGGFIPSTRQELANVLWTTAGKPDPVSTALYTDIPADNIEQQKAARWCVEQGLLSDHGATFGPDTTVTNARIIRAWNSLKKVPVTIQ